MPKVSVIVPVYNVEKYLRKCLDSVVNQTLEDIEIICIDDGSTDSSGAILDEYAQKNKRIKVIHKKNEGQSIARNIGINLAQGEYIGFVDSDDWISTGFYEKLYSEAIKYGADISITSIDRIYSENNIKKLINIQEHKQSSDLLEKFALASLPKNNYVVNKIYKTDFLRMNNLFFIPGIFWEDMRWTPIVIEKVAKVVTVPGECYYYFAHPGETVFQVTTNSRKYRDYTEALKWLKNYVIEKGIPYSDEIFTLINDFKCTKVTYKLFGFIPLLKIEERKNFSKKNQADLRVPDADFDNFLYHDIRPNSVLMVEFNSFHGECLPGMAKYFVDLGYNIDVCLNPAELDIEPFADFNSDKIKLFKTSKATLKRILTSDVIEKYAHVYINSDQIYDQGFVPVFDYIGSNIKFPEGKIITLCHHAEKFDEIEPKSDKFAVVTLNNLPILEGRNYAMVNAHYFGDFKRTTKNNVVNFICVGIIESARKNHSLLFDAVDYLLQRGINNFKITIVARGGNLRIPQHIRPYLDFKGRLSYKDMYTELKKADFYLPLFDVENHDHERYLTCGSSGSYQLIYGFTLPCIIPHKFQTKVNGFNNENSLGYEQNADLGSAMKTAIEMTEKQYKEKVVAIEKLSAEIYATSAENMKKILQAAENKYANNYFISLGENCFNRTVLTRHHLKSKREQGEKSYPFDLCVCSFSSMKQLIENDFADYFNDLVWNDKDQLWINSKYDIRYNHDQDCAKNNREKLIERYQRRINNFREMMRDGHEHVFVFSSISESTKDPISLSSE